LADLHFEVLKHPAYSLHLVPSDYLLPSLKKHLKGKSFEALRRPPWGGGVAAQPNELFSEGFKKLEQQRLKCMEFMGKYINTLFSIL
jgi:hypothetical protein